VAKISVLNWDIVVLQLWNCNIYRVGLRSREITHFQGYSFRGFCKADQNTNLKPPRNILLNKNVLKKIQNYEIRNHAIEFYPKTTKCYATATTL
jgi:hypothetical protein